MTADVSSKRFQVMLFDCLCVEKRLADLLLSLSRVVADHRSLYGKSNCVID